MTEARVGRLAYALGFAGLLPQVAAVVMLVGSRWADMDPQLPIGIAIAYPSIILSFLGGMWWSFAMRRGGAGQGRLAALAVLPSLAALALLGLLGATQQIGWCVAGVGSVIMLTLLVDRYLATAGEAPAGWMALRIPLSLGLGGLTIIAGALIGGPAVHV